MNSFRKKCFMRNFALFCAVIAAVCLAGEARAKSPEDVFTVRDGEWALVSGGEPDGSCGGSPALGLYWYAVNPETDGAAKGLERGALLYDGGAGKYSFLPLREEQMFVDDIFFSPDRKTLVVASRMSRNSSSLAVYDLASLAPRHELLGWSEIYFADGARFAFTRVDTGVERSMEAGIWGTSAAIYAPGTEKGFVVLKGASAKENFFVTGADENGIVINTVSVESEDDWNDTDKWKEGEITVEVPPAGQP
jgi:hypothetical protein